MLSNVFSKIVNFSVTSKEKAVYAFVASAVGSYLVQNGLTLKDITTVHALWALIVGVVTHQLVYWKSNS